MNEQGVSEIWFDERHTAPLHDATGAFGAMLAQGLYGIDKRADAFATGYVVALMQTACQREMQHHIDVEHETAMSTSICISHHALVPHGQRLRLTGWVVQIGERRVTFEVRLLDHERTLSEGNIVFAVVACRPVEAPRARIAPAARLAEPGPKPKQQARTEAVRPAQVASLVPN